MEVGIGRLHSAKATLYQAVATCPWSKELILDCFRLLGPVMSPSENDTIFRLLEERGLRVRTLVEEVELLDEENV